MLLPYFQRYCDYGEYPDGRAIIDQSIGLVSSLEVFKSALRRYEAKELSQATKEK